MVKVSGKPTPDEIAKLRAGVSIDAGDGRRVRTAPARIETIRDAANPWYEVTLIEGRNRQIRRMFEQVGHHVEKIKRVRYGPLQLDVPPGKYRILQSSEVARLKVAVSAPKKPFTAEFAENAERTSRRSRRTRR